MSGETTGTRDLRMYLRILWRWKFLFLLFLVAFPVAAYLIERGKPKTYQSSTLLELQAGTGTAGSAPVAAGDVQAAARIVTTTPLAEKAAVLMNLPASSGSDLVGEVSASADQTTGFITITAQDRSPYRAASIATAFAKALGTYQTTQALQSIQLQIKSLRQQLQHTAPASQAPITQQIGALRAEIGATGQGAQIVQPAAADLNPVGPKTRRSVELALIIGLLVGIGAVILAENSDRRLRAPEDLESITDWPLLGTIPNAAFTPGAPAPRVEEAFHMLEASLTYFNVDRRVSSVAVMSPLLADGKTTVAVGLALAGAQAGKRVILIDADLRRPQVHARLGIPEGEGLGAVLAGDKDPLSFMVEVGIDAPDALPMYVLPAGPPPPNPAALIASERMRSLIARLEAHADLVVVDTAAALAVSDALPLLQSVSGVVTVVRMNQSSRASVRRLKKLVNSAHGVVLGAVATGVTTRGARYGDYYYGDYRRRKGHRLPRPFRRHKKAALRLVPLSQNGAAPANGVNGAHPGEPEHQPAEAQTE